MQCARRFVRLETCDCSWTEDKHAMSSFAAQHLLPRVSNHVKLLPRQHVHAKDRRRRVADREALTLRGDPIEIGNTHASSCAIVCEDNVMCWVCLGQIRERAKVGADLGDVLQLEFLRGVFVPPM